MENAKQLHPLNSRDFGSGRGGLANLSRKHIVLMHNPGWLAMFVGQGMVSAVQRGLKQAKWKAVGLIGREIMGTCIARVNSGAWRGEAPFARREARRVWYGTRRITRALLAVRPPFRAILRSFHRSTTHWRHLQAVQLPRAQTGLRCSPCHSCRRHLLYCVERVRAGTW